MNAPAPAAQQQPQQDVEQVRNQLIQAQSRSFELISNLTAERDAMRQTSKNLETILGQIVTLIGLEGDPQVNNVFARLKELVDQDIQIKAAQAEAAEIEEAKLKIVKDKKKAKTPH